MEFVVNESFSYSQRNLFWTLIGQQYWVIICSQHFRGSFSWPKIVSFSTIWWSHDVFFNMVTNGDSPCHGAIWIRLWSWIIQPGFIDFDDRTVHFIYLIGKSLTSEHIQLWNISHAAYDMHTEQHTRYILEFRYCLFETIENIWLNLFFLL